MDSQQPPPDLPIAGDGSMPVPVYDCHVILSPAADGTICARVSSLPEISARGRSERHVLQQIVQAFKAAVVHYRSAGEPIPWQPAPPLQPGETQRWIPVHL
jgi:predicted RNase H-like HicB family nuclease